MFRRFYDFLRGPSVACECGGRIYADLGWDEFHYICETCHCEITEREFRERRKSTPGNTAP